MILRSQGRHVSVGRIKPSTALLPGDEVRVLTERKPEPEHSVSVHEEHSEHNVQHVLEEIDEERRLRVLVGVETTQREDVDGETDQPDGQSGECAGGVGRGGRTEVSVLQQGDDDRP